MSRNTWNKYKSAWKLWLSLKHDLGLKENDRYTIDLGNIFTCWCLENSNLSASSVNQYVSALGKMENLVRNLRESGKKGFRGRGGGKG
jgi:hypothetical protein